jgi:hypothetical protein
MSVTNNHGDVVDAVRVQLFLVRHGETEGNKLGITLGQSGSVSSALSVYNHSVRSFDSTVV